jgi:hypothetical protein
MTTPNALLEDGPFDGERRDLNGESFQAELRDAAGRTATYFETSRRSPDGLTVWVVETE